MCYICVTSYGNSRTAFPPPWLSLMRGVRSPCPFSLFSNPSYSLYRFLIRLI